MSKIKLYIGIIIFILIPIVVLCILLSMDSKYTIHISCIVSLLMGGIGGIYIDSFLKDYKKASYNRGYDHGLDHAKEIEQYKNRNKPFYDEVI